VLVILSRCPFCAQSQLLLDAVPCEVRFGDRGGSPCAHLVAFHGELEVEDRCDGSVRSRFWLWARDRVPLTHYRDGECPDPGSLRVAEYVANLGLCELGTPAPPVPVRIVGGTSLDRELAEPGEGEFELIVPGGASHHCLLYHWSVYAQDVDGFVAALPDLVRRANP
jgi:hypothetical protein